MPLDDVHIVCTTKRFSFVSRSGYKQIDIYRKFGIIHQNFFQFSLSNYRVRLKLRLKS